MNTPQTTEPYEDIQGIGALRTHLLEPNGHHALYEKDLPDGAGVSLLAALIDLHYEKHKGEGIWPW